MGESQRFGVQGLPWQGVKHVPQERVVFPARRPFDRYVATVSRIPEQGVTDVLHVDPNLVGPAGFQFAFHERHRTQALQHAVMGDGVLSFIAVGKHLLHADANFTQFRYGVLLCLEFADVHLHPRVTF